MKTQLIAAAALASLLVARSAVAADQSGQGPQAGQTGVGQRGTEVAPSTNPSQTTQPATHQTGVEPRGTEVGPSTTPKQEGQNQ